MYVCICKNINDKDIIKAVEAGNDSFEKLQQCLDVATCCGCCEPMVNDILIETMQKIQSQLIMD